MMKKMYGDDCLSSSRIHEWFKRFQEGREALDDDERSGRPRNVVNEENAEIVREFLRKEPKSSLKYMESELGISAASIYRILTYLGLCQICAAHFKTTRKRRQNFWLFDQKSHCNHRRILYSPDMAPCDFYLFGKLHLAMKGKRYIDVDAIQKASTAIFNAVPKDDLKKS